MLTASTEPAVGATLAPVLRSARVAIASMRAAIAAIAMTPTARLVAVMIVAGTLVGAAVALATAPPPTGGVAGAPATPPHSGTPSASRPPTRSGTPAASGTQATSGTPGPSGSAAPGSPAPPNAGASPTTATTVVTTADARSWASAGATSLEVLVAVRNQGPVDVTLDASGSRYTVADPSGGGVTTGRFTVALPERLGPGATGFLVATDSTALVGPSAPLSVRPEVAAEPVTGPAPTLDAQVTRLEFGPAGPRVSARVTNRSSSAAANVVVGAVLLDHHDRPIAALYGLSDVGPLPAGRATSVTMTYPPAGPIDAESVGRVVLSAYELE